MNEIALVTVGSAFTILTGLIAAFVSKRDEHSRWIRERRHDAYRDLFIALAKLGLHLNLNAVGKTDDESERRFTVAVWALSAAVTVERDNELFDSYRKLMQSLDPSALTGDFEADLKRINNTFAEVSKRIQALCHKDLLKTSTLPLKG